MADRELRIRAIADVSQAKAALQSLSGEQVKQQAAATASDAAAKRQAADLAKLQLENAKATGAGAEAVKKLGQEFKAAAAEAKVAAAEAKVLARAASEVRVQERNQAFAARQSERQKAAQDKTAAAAAAQLAAQSAQAETADAREGVRAKKVALRGLVPEGVLNEQGGISRGALAGGLSAAITAAIFAGFKLIAEEQRAAQKASADKSSSLVDQMDEIAKKGRENGMSDADIGKLLNAIQTLPGVADSSTLAKAALAKVSEGDTQGALGAVLKAAEGEKPVTELQAAEQAKRRGLRDVERVQALTNVDNVQASAGEEQAKAIRADMQARGAQTVIGRGLAAGASVLGMGEQSQLAALDFGNQVTVRGPVTATVEALTGTRDKGGSKFDPIFVESNQPRRLGGD